MKWGEANGEVPPVTRVLAERCAMLGAQAWWSCPGDDPIPLFDTMTGPLAQAVARAAGAWLDEDVPVPIPSGVGSIWLLPVIVLSRRRRDGLLIAACEERDERSAAKTFTALCAMRDDIRRLWEADLAVDAFTDQLTDTYEHVSMLHRLSRKMDSVTSPGSFIGDAAEELASVCGEAWSVVLLEPEASAITRGTRALVRGTAAGQPGFEDAAREASKLFEDVSPKIVDLDPESDLARVLGRQVVGAALRVDSKRAGAVLFGRPVGGDFEATSQESQLVETVSTFAGTLLDASRLYQKQEALYLGIIKAMSSAIDAKDRYTRGHSERVATLAKQLALAAGVSKQEAHRIYIAGVLHDVGKIGVPERVLLKPGTLTDGEMDEIRKHPGIGHEILKSLPGLEDILPAVLHHHERWDGEGYPAKLAGEDIPLAARIMAIADTFDAMSSNRAYRPARDREQVLEVIQHCAGSQFDPALAPLILEIDLSEFDRLMARHKLDAIDRQSGDRAA